MLDSKQIVNGSASLDPKAAGGAPQLSDAWVKAVLNKIDVNSEAYQAVSTARLNGTLYKGVIGVDRNSGQLVMVRVQ